MDYKNKHILITGGHGFLGSHLVKKLVESGYRNIRTPRRRAYDLRRERDIKLLLSISKPDVIIHLAAVVGGIGANMANPGQFFYDNAIMGIQLIEQARIFGVEKFVCIGTVCAYPKFAQVPFLESSIWDGYPEETNAPYGLAKKMLLVQLQAYRQKYEFNGIFLLPTNLYGPGDNFNDNTSHVIPAIIKKCFYANHTRSEYVKLWGTGEATREFLFVEDAADGIIAAMNGYDSQMPVNLGTGQEIPISALARKIAEKSGYSGMIEFDHDRPNGQPRRCLDTSRALGEFGWKATTSLDDGLSKTISWYREIGSRK